MSTHVAQRDALPMHVVLNAQLLSLSASYRSAGISGYIYHLLNALPAAAADFRFTAFTGEGRWQPPAGMDAARTRLPVEQPAARILWEQLAQPAALAWLRPALLHALAYVAPAAWPGPMVVTVLDLSFVLYPERFRPLNRLYLRVFTRLSTRRARRVIAISESTRRDAVRLLGLDAGRVHTVYCGVEPEFQPQSAERVAAFRRSKGLPARFVLFLGTLEPRKNIVGLLDAYADARARWEPARGEMPALVIAGAKGWYYQEVFRRVEELGLGASVQFAGFAPAQELPLWYSAAELFVYPSLYEGFGLPVLEAMACGTPVITSDCSSLPEVVGSAGVTVNPTDQPALSAALWQMLIEEDRRVALGEAGRRRAARFSWERTALETVAVYRQALGQEE
jgi:glycosyltransferase involved in cell wall biosynthesis